MEPKNKKTNKKIYKKRNLIFSVDVRANVYLLKKNFGAIPVPEKLAEKIRQRLSIEAPDFDSAIFAFDRWPN